MSLERPLIGMKIHGFGAFHQCAVFFLDKAKREVGQGRRMQLDEEKSFLKDMSVMHTLFDIKYLYPQDLPADLQTERDAWQLLSPHVGNWIGKFSAFLDVEQGDPQNLKILLNELESLMKQWGVISSSFKLKLESHPPDETKVIELIQRLKEKAAQVLSGV